MKRAFMPPAEHPMLAAPKIGVLLVNLGTPDGTDYRSVRRYLKQFLSDQRVIEIPPAIWRVILNLFILPRRPFATGRAYAKIWNDELNESPLRTITREQATQVAEALSGRIPGLIVDWAMRYGSPSIADKLEALRQTGCDRILVFGLYPQYSATTTATVYDEAFRSLMNMRWQPYLRTAPAYHDEPAYITALANSVRDQIDQQGWEPEMLVTSFHGLPQKYLDKGDPYHCTCHKTARLLREELGWAEDRFLVTFQSRFGPQEWLKPYFDETIAALPERGIKRVTTITPGFAADCLETLEEIALEGKEIFEEAGGEQYSMVPCLNTRPDHVAMIADIVARELSGWIEVQAEREARQPEPEMHRHAAE
ncbi:ferrochelatase [Rhodothalassium salexigens]|uniref:ferrochelatase n=1 Tax=Rhodothalassium salexigens TaxID=1086 RepID=UPI001912C3DD|nr:ferrochelatase [Rhodothalassium salexigens]MBK5912071.1 ferrochelatase [Rhodothalassium salexigens]MBK5921171.1 ferrochelatase [Rhodothalassium salexigens]